METFITQCVQIGYAYPAGISAIEIGNNESKYKENGIVNSFCTKITSVFFNEEDFPYIKLLVPLDIPSLSINNGVVILNRGKSSDSGLPNKISFALKYNSLKEYLLDASQLRENISNVVNRATELLSEVEAELFYTATPVVIAHYKDGFSSNDKIIAFRIDSNSGDIGPAFRRGNKYDETLIGRLFNVDALPPESRKLYDYVIKNKKVSSIENCIQLFPEVNSFFTDKKVEKDVLATLKKGNTVYWDDVKDYISFKFNKIKINAVKGINVGRYDRAEILWSGYLYIHDADSYIKNTSFSIIEKIGKTKFVTDNLYSLFENYNRKPFSAYTKVPCERWQKFLEKNIVAFKLPVKGKPEEAYEKAEGVAAEELKEVVINRRKYKVVHDDGNLFVSRTVYSCGNWYVLLKLNENTNEAHIVDTTEEKNRILNKIYADKIK